MKILESCLKRELYQLKIRVIKNNEIWKENNLDGENSRIVHNTWIDNEPIEGLSYWSYTNINPKDHKKDGKYYTNGQADNGVNSPEDLSTQKECFYYIKFCIEGSEYYNENFDNLSTELVELGDDLAWIGPIWVLAIK